MFVTSAPGAPAFTAQVSGVANPTGEAPIEIYELRLAHLKKLAHQCSVDGTTVAGLDNLIKFVARWRPKARAACRSRCRRPRSACLRVERGGQLASIFVQRGSPSLRWAAS